MVQAKSNAESISDYCTGAAPASRDNPELARLLEDLQNKFKSQNERVARPQALISALDNVLAHSDFALTLSCRQNLQRQGYSYKLIFQDPSKGDSVRFSLYGEIAAFYEMQVAYRKFVALSPRLCRVEGTKKDPKDEPLFKGYIESEKDLARGDFAQVVVSGYQDAYQKDCSEFLDLSSLLHVYVDPESKTSYELNSLDQRLINLISRLPIPVTEPASVAKPATHESFNLPSPNENTQSQTAK